MFSIEYEGLEEVTKTLIEHCNNLDINMIVLHLSRNKTRLVFGNNKDLCYVKSAGWICNVGTTLKIWKITIGNQI